MLVGHPSPSARPCDVAVHRRSKLSLAGGPSAHASAAKAVHGGAVGRRFIAPAHRLTREGSTTAGSSLTQDEGVRRRRWQLEATDDAWRGVLEAGQARAGGRKWASIATRAQQ
jgi:hypothetical protein